MVLVDVVFRLSYILKSCQVFNLQYNYDLVYFLKMHVLQLLWGGSSDLEITIDFSSTVVFDVMIALNSM